MGKLYELKLKPGFPGPRRVRSGIAVVAGVSNRLELTEEQYQAFKADPEVIITEVAEEKPAAKGKSNTTKQMVEKQAERTA